MKNMLKNLGVTLMTGSMAIFGFVMGLVMFKPENITFTNSNDKNVESK